VLNANLNIGATHIYPKVLPKAVVAAKYFNKTRSTQITLPNNRRRTHKTLYNMLAIPASSAKEYKTNWLWKMEKIGCPKTLVSRCQPALFIISGEQRPKLHCGESLKYSQVVITGCEIQVRRWDET
jgi:hypothetical protein